MAQRHSGKYSWALSICVVLCFALGTGCSSGRLTEVVEGIVTLDGKPIAGIRVFLEPKSSGDRFTGVGSFGITNEEGRFAVRLSDSQSEGAVIGLHSVILSDQRTELEADAGVDVRKAIKSRIPIKYNYAPLTLEVKAGKKNVVQFKLTSE